MDDISSFLDDVRELGAEFDTAKDEIVSSVVDLGRELAGDEASAEPQPDKTDQL